MMRQEKLLIKLPEQLDWDIREDRRLISFQKKEIQMQLNFPRAKIEGLSV